MLFVRKIREQNDGTVRKVSLDWTLHKLASTVTIFTVINKRFRFLQVNQAATLFRSEGIATFAIGVGDVRSTARVNELRQLTQSAGYSGNVFMACTFILPFNSHSQQQHEQRRISLRRSDIFCITYCTFVRQFSGLAPSLTGTTG